LTTSGTKVVKGYLGPRLKNAFHVDSVPVKNGLVVVDFLGFWFHGCLGITVRNVVILGATAVLRSSKMCFPVLDVTWNDGISDIFSA
jgi:hypothetical protein